MEALNIDKNGVFGSGKIKPELMDKAIAAFCGGFMPVHDDGGFFVDGKELVPLKYNKGTLIVYDSGEIEICNYNQNKEKWDKKAQ